MFKKDFDELDAGDWCFINGESYIGIRLGEGETDCCILPVRKDDDVTTTRDRTCWNWNGSKEAPTLTPSILHWGKGKNSPATWHGYMTDGKLVTV
jgi:hypothetical protein